MNSRKLVSAFLCACLGATLASASPIYLPSPSRPPPPQREFRGTWVATVGNIDWPSKPGLPVGQQKAELLVILDRAAALNLNAVILQVRPACDALYASSLEPWSPYLTGVMGKAPEPFYDPLAFAVTEAHKRGLELHAWINPYRAAVSKAKFPISPNHISRANPGIVRSYGSFLWLDPGEPAARDYSLRVVLDIVKRYDIDGLHIDDYFYPYRELDANKREMDFPDDASWLRYGAGGGLSRDDWRRENVNSFVRRLYESIKAAKPWVKFGVSPFGIWQPGFPAQVRGFNAYATLYCDSRKWLMNGWLDYFVPQLYWAIQPPEQSFPALFKWWQAQNLRGRSIWPGVDSGKTMTRWRPEEILNQINYTRDDCRAEAGVVHWSMSSLDGGKSPLGAALRRGPYAERAVVPASPWLEPKYFDSPRLLTPRAMEMVARQYARDLPSRPVLKIDRANTALWEVDNAEKVSVWVLQTKTGSQWKTTILPKLTRHEMLAGDPEIIALTAIDRCGVAGSPTVLQRFETKRH